ncbi:8-oxo-dGTP diphosphatase [Nocardioides daedukensis]|uniref:8-oxo-dGTP diphosphatase n=1 Tax=Nocardioides daedukensis TaxID=634462 RepID=A0A7Y9UVR7_9ACTN|nr:8-oxo-dGTP diphosphatase [Nocardioides daedukensis]
MLVQQRSRSPRGLVLPGRFVRKGETFADAVRATLSEKVGIEDAVAEPRLLKMYDDPRRDQRGWVMSALHVLALPVQALADASGDLLAVDEAGRLADRRHLVFDHDDMLAAAVQRMRSHYEATPDPYRLLGNSFTLGQLRDLHESVLGEPLLKDTFNRRMKGYLTEKMVKGEPVREQETGGRPALVYVRSKDTELSQRERRRLLLPRR